jgi:raffinose/stachyose/melibiose transport system permease protein
VRTARFRPVTVISTLLMLVLAAAFAYPIALAVMTSLKTQDEIIASPLSLPHHLDFSAYQDAWNAVGFGNLLENSFLYAGAGSLLAVLLAIFPAYAFSRFAILGGRTLFILLLTTLMVPPQTVIIPLFDFLNNAGLLDSRKGLIAVYAVYGMPFVMLLLTGFMSSVPRELEEAARVDGSGDLGVLCRIVVPVSLPAMAVAFTLNFILVWKEFIFALTFLNSDNVQPVTVGLVKFTSTQYFTAFNLPAAAVIMAQLPMVLVFVVAYRWIRSGLYVGAVKG